MTVFINGKPAVRQGDQTKHCGGLGKMIEGSQNVIIGGPPGSGSSGGAGGGGGGGGAGGGSPGGGGGTSSGSGSGGSGGGAGGGSGGAGGGAGASSESSRGSSSGGSGAPGSAAGGTQATDTKPEPEPDKFTLWIQPEAINGGKLTGETVSIIDPDTHEVVTQTKVDDDGNVLASVPANKPYDLRIDGAADDVPGEDRGIDALASNHLCVALFDATGEPLAPGVKVAVRGMGTSHDYVTGAAGDISPELPPGKYEVTVNGETFLADTLRSADLQHDGGGPYMFQLGHHESEPDYAPLERGREQRLPASDLDEV